ncbi:MAG: hypothetical protein KAR37_08040, partial [Alphaproteobacteria bacterium]|nr:hypothetical protein [Alphaproteobacteria bacterium]
LTMRKHRLRTPSCRGDGKRNPTGTIRLIHSTSNPEMFEAVVTRPILAHYWPQFSVAVFRAVGGRR